MSIASMFLPGSTKLFVDISDDFGILPYKLSLTNQMQSSCCGSSLPRGPSPS